MPTRHPDPHPVCADHDLTPGHPIRVVLDGRPLLLVRTHDDTIHAVDDTCTHADISLTDGFVEGTTVECWAHGARFDLTTGVPLTLPASEPLTVHEVTVHDGTVFVRTG